jgi:hypothetical protein
MRIFAVVAVILGMTISDSSGAVVPTTAVPTHVQKSLVCHSGVGDHTTVVDCLKLTSTISKLTSTISKLTNQNSRIDMNTACSTTINLVGIVTKSCASESMMTGLGISVDGCKEANGSKMCFCSTDYCNSAPVTNHNNAAITMIIASTLMKLLLV